MGREAVVLLSGGVDSATCAAIAQSEGFTVYGLTVDYGQRHRFELEAARRIAQHLGLARHIVIAVDLSSFVISALTGPVAVPKDRSPEECSREIPPTYVPARNTILLALALGLAETLGTGDIFIGVNAVDYSGYPDCRPQFIEAFERLAELATKAGLKGELTFQIHTPLITLKKADIIRRGIELGLDYSLTHSCYDPLPSGMACGRCDACLLRRKGFAEAGLVDPIPYHA